MREGGPALLLLFSVNSSARRGFHCVNRCILLFPVPDSAELPSLITGSDKFLCGARRAPAAGSVENQFNIFGDIAHSGIQVAHRNVYGSRNGAILSDLACLAQINQQKVAACFQFLLQLRNRDPHGFRHVLLHLARKKFRAL